MELKNYKRHTKADGFTSNVVSGRILSLVRDYRSKVAAIQGDPMVPQESKDLLVAGEKRAAQDALQSLQLRGKATFGAAKGRLKAKAQDAFYKGTTAADVARQEVAARHIRGLLDAGIGAQGIADDMATRGDCLGLHVLEAEYPVYEWSRTGRRPDPEEVDALIGPAKMEAGDDAYNGAVEALEELESLEYKSQVNAAQAAGELERGEIMDSYLAADGSVQDVSGDDTK